MESKTEHRKLEFKLNLHQLVLIQRSDRLVHTKDIKTEHGAAIQTTVLKGIQATVQEGHGTNSLGSSLPSEFR